MTSDETIIQLNQTIANFHRAEALQDEGKIEHAKSILLAVLDTFTKLNEADWQHATKLKLGALYIEIGEIEIGLTHYLNCNDLANISLSQQAERKLSNLILLQKFGRPSANLKKLLAILKSLHLNHSTYLESLIRVVYLLDKLNLTKQQFRLITMIQAHPMTDKYPKIRIMNTVCLGNYFQARGSLNMAFIFYTKAIKAAKKNRLFILASEAMFELAQLYVKNNKFKKAESILLEASKYKIPDQHSIMLQVNFLLLEVYQHLGKFMQKCQLAKRMTISN